MSQNHFRVATIFFMVTFCAVLVMGITEAAPPSSQTVQVPRTNTPPPNLKPQTDGQITTVALVPNDVWRTGATVKIQWTWPGYVNFLADVMIGKGTGAAFQTEKTIIAGWSNSSIGWEVPFAFSPGTYTIRVQSSKNPQNFADATVRIENSTLSIVSPQPGQTWATGSTNKIVWSFQGKPGPLKIELVLPTGNAQTLSGNWPWGELGAGQFTWQLPTTLTTDPGYRIRLTSTTNSGISATSQIFGIENRRLIIDKPANTKPGNTEFTAGESLEFAYFSDYLPTDFKAELVNSAGGNVATELYKAIRLKTGRWSCGTAPSGGACLSWGKLPVAATTESYKIRMTHLGLGTIYESSSFTVKPQAVSTNTTPASTGASSSGSSTGSSSGSTSGSVSGTVVVSNKANCNATQQLSADTPFNYNNSQSAIFNKSSVVKFDTTNCHVLSGQLAGDQSLEYANGKKVRLHAMSGVSFVGGYVATGQLMGEQSLEYSAGKTVRLYHMSGVTFANRLVTQGQLLGDQNLEYGPGKSVSFRSNSLISFEGGYVTKGQLAYDSVLRYSSSESAISFDSIGITEFRSGGYVRAGYLGHETTLKTAGGKTVTLPALAQVTFDDNGRLKGY